MRETATSTRAVSPKHRIESHTVQRSDGNELRCDVNTRTRKARPDANEPRTAHARFGIGRDMRACAYSNTHTHTRNLTTSYITEPSIVSSEATTDWYMSRMRSHGLANREKPTSQSLDAYTLISISSFFVYI